MRTVRRSSFEQGIRINYIAPGWTKSAIRSATYEKWLTDLGVQFGEQADIGNCMMRIACDKEINGKQRKEENEGLQNRRTAANYAYRPIVHDCAKISSGGGIHGFG